MMIFRSIFRTETSAGTCLRFWIIFAGVVFLRFSGNAGAESILSEFELPLDEFEAQEFIREGILDSNTWQALQPYYRRPLQVPAGELSVLPEVFPELSNDLPVDAAVLERYQPWNRQAIRRFFREYPDLKKFRPLLSFNYRPARGNGSARFYMNKSGYDTSANHTAKFDMRIIDNSRIQGSVDLTSDYARWYRRTISFHLSPRFSASLGNAVLFSDKGLMYGYFPSSRLTENSISDNWLYSSVSTWNGAFLNWSADGKSGIITPEIQAFVHYRPTEKITGVSSALTIRSGMVLQFGITGMKAGTDNSVKPCLHGAARIKWLDVDTDVHCALPERKQLLIPVYIRNRIVKKQHTMNLTVVHLPKSFSASRSSLLHRFANELEMGDTLSESVTLVRLGSNSRYGSIPGIQPQCDLWFIGENISHGTLRLRYARSMKKVEGRISLAQEFAGNEERLQRTMVTAGLQWHMTHRFSVRTDQYFSRDQQGSLRYRAAVSPIFLLFGCCSLEPLASLHFFAASRHIYTGYRQKLTLFRKTFTEFRVEKEIGSFFSERWPRVEGKAFFYF